MWARVLLKVHHALKRFGGPLHGVQKRVVLVVLCLKSRRWAPQDKHVADWHHSNPALRFLFTAGRGAEPGLQGNAWYDLICEMARILMWFCVCVCMVQHRIHVQRNYVGRFASYTLKNKSFKRIFKRCHRRTIFDSTKKHSVIIHMQIYIYIYIYISAYAYI